MIEKGVKFFWFLSNLILTLTYAIAWFRGNITTYFPSFNPVELHFITAIPATLFHFFAALGVLFYFIGTGVWIKDEAMSLAKNDRSKAEKVYEVFKKANRLKGRAFPFITFSIFFGIMTFVLGGARHVEAIPLWIHPAVGTALLAVSLASFPFIYPAIDQNVIYLDEASSLLEQS
jgi:hypothetical protein